MDDLDLQQEEELPPLRSALVDYPLEDDPYILNRTNTDDQLVAEAHVVETPGIRKSKNGSIRDGQEESLIK